MGLEENLICALVNDSDALGTFNKIIGLGVNLTMFKSHGNVWQEIENSVANHNKVPSGLTLNSLYVGKIEWDKAAPEKAEFYVERLLKRERHNILTEAGRKLHSQLDKDDLEEAERTLFNAMMDSSRIAGVKMAYDGTTKSVTDERWDKYTEMNGRMRISGIETPWPSLSETTFGWHPEELILVVGRTNVGKTFMEMMFAHATWKDEKIPLVASLEMSRDVMLKRWDAINFGLPYDWIRKSRLGKFQEQWYKERLNELAKEQAAGNLPPFLVAESKSVRSVPELASLCRRYSPNMVFVDGAYLLQDQLRAKSLWERVTNIADELVVLGSEFKIPIMATVQFNKQVNIKKMTGGTENIGLSDRLGQNAHVAIGLFQNKDLRGRKQILGRLLKNRDGELIEWLMKWDFDLMNFGEVSSRKVGQDDSFGELDEDFVDDETVAF